MAKPPRDRSETTTRTYFITARTWQGRALFRSDRMVELFLETLQSYREQGKFDLHEFVVMPNHIHVLLTPAPSVTLERAVQLIKGNFSHRVGREISRGLEVWQRGYIDHRIRDANDYARHREYIRQNPVRARLANSPEESRCSSAHPSFQLDPPPQGLKPRV